MALKSVDSVSLMFNQGGGWAGRSVVKEISSECVRSLPLREFTIKAVEQKRDSPSFLVT